jgi:hypothetical protein
MRNLVLLSAVFAMVFAVAFAQAEEKAKPKYTIKQVMKMAHKDGLKDKVVKGNGSAEDAKQLLALYQALAANKPKKGDAESWKEKTGVIVVAAKGVVAGKDGSLAALGKAVNCGACHKVHK